MTEFSFYTFNIHVKVWPLVAQMPPNSTSDPRQLTATAYILLFSKGSCMRVSIFVLNPYKMIMWNLKYHISLWGDELTLVGKLLRIFAALSPFTEPLSCFPSQGHSEFYWYKSFDPLLNGQSTMKTTRDESRWKTGRDDVALFTP